ncbi:MAG: hypothetical protein H6835_01875 [Planctomycetes bacterium]|nr:hypothetical protein [Planctomycetota bacterium]
MLSLTTGPAPWPDADAALLALAQRGAFVAQSSVAHRDHLTDAALRASAHAGPALLHVLAPSPRAWDVAADAAVRVAAQAVAARAFLLFVYDPSQPGAFGEKLPLHGNRT